MDNYIQMTWFHYKPHKSAFVKIALWESAIISVKYSALCYLDHHIYQVQ